MTCHAAQLSSYDSVCIDLNSLLAHTQLSSYFSGAASIYHKLFISLSCIADCQLFSCPFLLCLLAVLRRFNLLHACQVVCNSVFSAMSPTLRMLDQTLPLILHIEKSPCTFFQFALPRFSWKKRTNMFNLNKLSFCRSLFFSSFPIPHPQFRPFYTTCHML